MQANPVKARRKKYPGYSAVLVVWHDSITQEFDPVTALKALADSRGLLVDEKASTAVRRLRVDSVESSQLRKRSQPIDRSIRQDAAKLLRRALKDPRSAERIKGLVERARHGEDMSQGLPDAMDTNS
jgi:hypothetical protein